MNYKVKYFDGISATSKILTLRIEEDRIYLYPNENSSDPIKSWHLKDIFIDKSFNSAVVIGNKSKKGKIEFLESSQEEQLLKDLKLSNEHLGRFSSSQLISWIGGLLLIAFTIWLSLPALSKLIANQMSFENETKIANLLPIDQHFKMCSLSVDESRALKNYQDYLYPKNSIETKMPIKLQVANLSQVNAFTFPGGNIILLTGIIKEVKTPEELLSIIAHEIGHVSARDNLNFLIRSSILTSFFAYLTGDFSSAAIINPQTIISIMALSYDREMEMNADRFAINRLSDLNISQKGMYDFFMRRKNESDNKIPEMVLTHPNYENRLKNINKQSSKHQLSAQIEADFKIIKNICQ